MGWSCMVLAIRQSWRVMLLTAWSAMPLPVVSLTTTLDIPSPVMTNGAATQPDNKKRKDTASILFME